MPLVFHSDIPDLLARTFMDIVFVVLGRFSLLKVNKTSNLEKMR